MSRHPRGLSPEEAALWDRLAASVTPLHPVRKVAPKPVVPMPEPAKAPVRKAKGRVPPAAPPKAVSAPPPPAPGLDSHWERRLARAAIAPDFTLDLHGHTLEQAHARLDTGLAQAKAMGARMVLLITGKPRPAASADRGERRGAIRAKILDWLAAGPHAGEIAAVRNAHRRHGGEGALYLVLRRQR
ncbi:Smr/MutS family protein [Aurantiacibacter flavus]|uniref:Smr/MutS family protein n=1 Tax=Aurantiacibacter flavus TaxID=3145232 RepID=A0ABV0CZR5_9SPHN